LGRQLYRRFATIARQHGRTLLRAETGSFNRASIAFHARLGFDVEPGDEIVDGVPIHRDRTGLGHDYVMFTMSLRDARL
jgi:predicted GNAT superfamily acetyltransferase